ncbi:kynurenine--oxoglutarate transaminase 3 isoform X2 [Oscarella lobularis]|uniref:kynurenine--oxoglutarate transaminase 3 isoform X2 n=1 Tax=Oscarella lobularis TaxID=121494 RepID=UPI003313210D
MRRFFSSPVTKTMSSYAAARTAATGKNVWVEFIDLALKYKPANLGQGFPDFAPPTFLKQALARAAMIDSLNQYTRSKGHGRLVQAIAKYYSPLHKKEIDPMNNILVTVGAYGALYCGINSLVDSGDEVVVIEPFFDSYLPCIKAAGGIPKCVPLRPKSKEVLLSADLTLDPDELAAAFSSKTKAVLLNTPNNPTGKVFERKELEMIADLCKKHDAICVSDEVYEYLVYEGEHIRIATLPGMWERTLTIGSAGKAFSVTGWKIGWTIGPAELIAAAHSIMVNCNYTCATPLQEGVALAFEREWEQKGKNDSYFVELPSVLKEKRAEIVKMLNDVGMKPIIPQGGYFILADTAPLNVSFEGEDAYDFQFCRWLTKSKGIAAIPSSAFYSREHSHLAGKCVRFCFGKSESTLQAARARFEEWKKEF